MIGKSRLLRKYEIGGEFPFLSILHPAHLAYIRRGSLNTLNYFFGVLDRLDPEKREQALGWAYLPIINPRRRRPITGKETIEELTIDEVSYDVFKAKCRDLIKVVEQRLLVFGLVHFILQNQFSISDLTSLDSATERHNSGIAYFETLIRELDAEKEEDKENLRRHLEIERELGLPEEDLGEGFASMVKVFTESRDTLEARTKRNYSIYEYFCEAVVSELLKEEIGL